MLYLLSILMYLWTIVGFEALMLLVLACGCIVCIYGGVNAEAIGEVTAVLSSIVTMSSPVGDLLTDR